jgi:long-chain alkane monooxygenase
MFRKAAPLFFERKCQPDGGVISRPAKLAYCQLSLKMFILPGRNGTMNKQMHLTGFMIYCPAPHMIMSWVYPREQIRHQWHETDYWVEIAQTLERGKLDMFFFADLWIGGMRDESIRYAIQFPIQDPCILVPHMAAHTRHLGFAITMSTTFYPPYMLARLLATLDHVTKGRIGWNIVSSIAEEEAAKFGVSLPPHDERYDRADEFMEVCYGLWDSWDEDALLMDMENGIFADPSKIHRLDYAGKYYQVQGPLTVIPSPQRRPYLFQAGASERGRDFAARHAECIFAAASGVRQMRAFCDDIAARAEANGRDPASIKILWGAQPLVAHSESEARARQVEIRERIPLEASLALMSGHFNYDLSTLDIDAPVGGLKVPGSQGMLEIYTKANPNVTLRQIAGSYLSGSDKGPMIGTPGQVADYLQYLLAEGGGDGFQITPSYYAPDYFNDLVRDLIPVLQARGAFRNGYEGKTLRDLLNGPGNRESMGKRPFRSKDFARR